ncbi:MAG: hypothetical protein EXR07_02255 [Acetobacteraceae bacterium]|nr:hypothetical protein [Acetobacteraceae bacterium]
MRRLSFSLLCLAMFMAPAVTAHPLGGGGGREDVILAGFAPPRDTGEALVAGGRDVNIWRPGPGGAAPIIVFSHGYGGCGTQSSFLTKALADAGYFVVAPRHADASCPGRTVAGRTEGPFRLPDVWSDTSWRDRADDIVAVVEALRRDPAFAGAIDWSRLGLMGHSLGGYTVLGLAGAWPSWRMPGVKAVAALSPTCAPFLQAWGHLGELTAPVSFQTGTRDFGIAPAVTRRGGCFDRITAPARLTVFRRAGHFAWTDYLSEARDNVAAETRDFFDVHLRGQPAATIRRRGVANARIK